MSLDLLNPEDRRNFTTGPTWRLFGNVWWTKPDPLDAFADVLCWLSWVAKRCPMSEVTSVDQQAGTISVITWLGLPEDFEGTIVSYGGEGA